MSRTTRLVEIDGYSWIAIHNSDWSGDVELICLRGDDTTTQRVPGEVVRALHEKMSREAVEEAEDDEMCVLCGFERDLSPWGGPTLILRCSDKSGCQARQINKLLGTPVSATVDLQVRPFVAPRSVKPRKTIALDFDGVIHKHSAPWTRPDNARLDYKCPHRETVYEPGDV